MMLFTVPANLLIKAGAEAARLSGHPLAGLMNWYILGGLSAFGCAVLIYLLVLQQLPLNVATSFAASQFIAVVIASAILLSEPVPPLRWVGIAMIATGIVLVGTTGR
jgi:drug/metabolite transporter (DMT)-like permease